MPAASAAIVFCKYGFIITAICESDVTRYGRNYENSKIKIKTDFARNAPGQGGGAGQSLCFFCIYNMHTVLLGGIPDFLSGLVHFEKPCNGRIHALI